MPNFEETFAQVMGREIHYQFMLWDLCGYNPQLLLTDQRSDLLKFIGEMSLGEVFGDDGFEDLMCPRKLSFHIGGTLTGRIPREPDMQRIPVLMPGNEIVIARDAYLDYGQAESRIFRGREHPTIVMTQIDTTRFQEQLRRAKVSLEELMTKVGVWDALEPHTYGTKMSRINDLQFSDDPRQRKRGLRLAEKRRRVKLYCLQQLYRKD